MLKNLKFSFILSSILYIALGVVLLIWPNTSLSVICYAFGGITLLYGLSRLASYLGNRENPSVLQGDAIFGVIMIGLGIFLLLKPDTILSILPIVLGLFIIFNSIIKLQYAFELKSAFYDKWWLLLFLGIITAALGTVIVLNPFEAMEVTVMIMGCVLIADGISNIFTILFVTFILHKLKRVATDLVLAGTKAETVTDVDFVEVDEEGNDKPSYGSETEYATGKTETAEAEDAAENAKFAEEADAARQADIIDADIIDIEITDSKSKDTGSEDNGNADTKASDAN